MGKREIGVFALFLICALMFLQPAHAVADKDGGDIMFKDTKKMAPVLFSHKIHQAKGNKCEDCHDSIFQKKAGSTDVNNALTKSAMKEGKYCGTCHDGEKAFSVDKECKKCHVKRD